MKDRLIKFNMTFLRDQSRSAFSPRYRLISWTAIEFQLLLYRDQPELAIVITKMRLQLCVFVVAAFFVGILKTEDCQILSSCIDTVCNHHTNLECVHGICTCSPPPYNIRCLDKGDCDRHSYDCSTDWKCINSQCRCGN
ncbi:serine protease inhibitor Cvsi-2-like [Ostrea edulis]|uniref:serine protease inhibitor Cvsi-2-like n=1 Tax=Ostrea edulis TaxID=37623 RepID=UPI0024AED743|nr:serine protease inhibitor Cvsi-2-like [Ostrea edulis]